MHAVRRQTLECDTPRAAERSAAAPLSVYPSVRSWVSVCSPGSSLTGASASRRFALLEPPPRGTMAEGVEALGLDARLVRALHRQKIVHPTAVQSQVVPIALLGKVSRLPPTCVVSNARGDATAPVPPRVCPSRRTHALAMWGWIPETCLPAYLRHRAEWQCLDQHLTSPLTLTLSRQLIPQLMFRCGGALWEQDVVARARTGSGKTLAYLLPLLHKLLQATEGRRADCFPRAMVLVPTRELCEQVSPVPWHAQMRTCRETTATAAIPPGVVVEQRICRYGRPTCWQCMLTAPLFLSSSHVPALHTGTRP
jgi:hypothetical protein